jgi:hypothetical protein
MIFKNLAYFISQVKVCKCKEMTVSEAWWYTPVIPALRRLRQKDHKFKASLDYTIRPCLQTTTTKPKMAYKFQF